MLVFHFIHNIIISLSWQIFLNFFLYNYGLARWKKRQEHTISTRPERTFVLFCGLVRLFNLYCILMSGLRLSIHHFLVFSKEVISVTWHDRSDKACCVVWLLSLSFCDRLKASSTRKCSSLFKFDFCFLFRSIYHWIWRSNYSGSKQQSNQNLLLINALESNRPRWKVSLAVTIATMFLGSKMVRKRPNVIVSSRSIQIQARILTAERWDSCDKVVNNFTASTTKRLHLDD